MVQRNVVGMMKAEILDRRQVLDEHAFMACMIEEIVAGIVILNTMIAGG